MLPGPAGAAPQTNAIPLATIGTAPQAGTLPNQVGWSVNAGTWNAAGQGYVIFGGASQTWTFDRPVSLRFSVRGLTGVNPQECMQVPVGSVLQSLAPSHSYNPATRLVCAIANVGSADTVFTLGPVSSLTLAAVGLPLLGRGPGFIEVTYNLPEAFVTAPAEGNSYVAGQSVPADYGCTGGTGAVASVGPVPNGQPFDTSVPGNYTFTVTCTDEFGATSAVTNNYSVGPGSAANDDEVVIQSNTPITFDPLANDFPATGGTLDPTTVVLLDGANPVTTLTNADGTYVVDPLTGAITFTPAPGFTGPSTGVPYRVTDSFGVDVTATITVSVDPTSTTTTSTTTTSTTTTSTTTTSTTTTSTTTTSTTTTSTTTTSTTMASTTTTTAPVSNPTSSTISTTSAPTTTSSTTEASTTDAPTDSCTTTSTVASSNSTTSNPSTTSSSTSSTTSSSSTTTTSSSSAIAAPPSSEVSPASGPAGLRRAPAQNPDPCAVTTTIAPTTTSGSGGGLSDGGAAVGGTLPRTGQHLLGPTAVGAVLLALTGAALVIAMRTRH